MKDSRKSHLYLLRFSKWRWSQIMMKMMN